MPQPTNKISQFWQELRRRKVIHIFLAYLATSYAIIEFLDITSNRFSIPDSTFNLLYILAAIGLPLAIILPWFINRHKQETSPDKVAQTEEPSTKEEQKSQHNLPVQLTSFIGRKKEMPLVRQLINDHRLITLIGAGGCGKTRLACEVATQLIVDYKDGVWFVDLSPITSEDLVVKEIMEVLKIQEVPNQPIVDTLTDQIRDKNLLIILDNCEHLVKACAETAGKLIQSVTGLKILATSREALCIKGEHIWRVPSLTLIDPKTIVDVEHAKDSEAVLLFADRAQMINPEFELETENVNDVVTICNKLDGIPLAVELVASRTRHMNPQMILERFADRFDKLSTSDPGTSTRQQTLQATIEWSYNLLSDIEKLLFVRLSVFSGGFDIAAAETVCSDEQLPKETILDTLSTLVDRSLVHTMKTADQTMRYNCLETLKQFGHQVIKKSAEEETLNKKHLQYYLKLAEEAYQEQYEDQLKWLNKLDMEEDNLMAALEWSDDHSPEEYCWLAGSLTWYWMLKSKYSISRQSLEKAHSIEKSKPEVQARVLQGLGYLLFMFNESERAFKYYNESLNIWHSLDNLQEQALVLVGMGGAYSGKIIDFETRLRFSEQGLEIARQLGKPGLINACLSSVCNILVHSKQFEKALPYVKELAVTSEKLKQPWGIMTAGHYRADCALGFRDFEGAEKKYGLGIKAGLKYGFEWLTYVDMQGVAFALSGQERLKKSLILYAASVAKGKSMGVSVDGMFEFWDEWRDTYIEGARIEVGEVLAKQYEEEGRAMGFEKAVEYALDFIKD